MTTTKNRTTIIALLALLAAGCSAGPIAQAPACEDGWDAHDGYCYRALFESTSARGAQAACERRGAWLAPADAGLDYLARLAGGRTCWLGDESEAGCAFLESGAVDTMSCYPQPDPTAYPRAYVCEVLP